MARALTPAELAYLRSEKQFSLLYLAFGSPATVFTARVNGVPASNDQVAEINYDGGSSGYGSAIADQTVLVGSTAGAYDRGIVRLRGTLSGASGAMKIGEESEIEWTDNDYLTVLDEIALWPRHLRITSAGVVYVDYEIAYSNQHSACDPVPVLGTPVVKRLTGSTVDVDFDASDSWVPGSVISAYAWSAPGASATSGMNTATPTITYNATGRYRVSCTLTAANGATFTGYRYARIFDESDPPTTNFRLDDCAGDWGRGGWSFRVTMFDEARLSEVRDRAQVILFARDWYGGTETSIGPVADRENIIAVGWIDGESIKWNPEQGSVSFTVQGPQFWMGKMMGFPTGIEDCSSTPTAWTEYEDLTLDAGLWHFLHWRTTATRCMDCTLTGDTRKISVFDSPAASLWQQISQESERAILAHPACDRYGRLFVQVDSNLMPESDRGAIPVVQALTTQDWRDQIDIERRVVDEAALVDMSGVAYTGGSSATPLFSLSPGHVFRRYGAVERHERLALASQTDANELCGLLAGKANNEYPNVDIRLAANHRAIDICPHQYITLTVAETDTERGISFTDKKFVPRRVSLRHNSDTGTLMTDITAEGYTTAELAVTGDPPPSPPDPPDPELPPDPTPAPTPGLWTGAVKAAVAWNGSQIGYTADLLRHQVVSTTTAGTSGTTLYDTSLDDHPGEDFNDVGVAVGDLVENLSTHARTTVAAVVSGSQLTLTADIGLGVGDDYHISGTEWHDISGSIVLNDDEDVIDFLYVQTDDATVGAWLLTDLALRWTADILTSSPVWTSKLTRTDIRSGGTYEMGASANFCAMAVDPSDPSYLIVNITGCTNYGTRYTTVEGALETSNLGTSWTAVNYTSSDQWGDVNQPNRAAGGADYQSIWIGAGHVYTSRRISGYGPTNPGYTDVWVDGVITGGYRNDRICYNYSFYCLQVVGGRVYIIASSTTDPPGIYKLALSTDSGENFASIDPAGNYGLLATGGLFVNRVDKDDLVLITVDSDAGGDCKLLRSTDAGSTWTEIANANDLFGDPCAMCNGYVATAPYIYEPDADVLCWSGRLKLSATTKEFLFYSDDGGSTWLNKRGDWIAEFSDWLGDDNNTQSDRNQLVPLPRVGANE